MPACIDGVLTTAANYLNWTKDRGRPIVDRCTKLFFSLTYLSTCVIIPLKHPPMCRLPLCQERSFGCSLLHSDTHALNCSLYVSLLVDSAGLHTIKNCPLKRFDLLTLFTKSVRNKHKTCHNLRHNVKTHHMNSIENILTVHKQCVSYECVCRDKWSHYLEKFVVYFLKILRHKKNIIFISR